MSEFLEVDSLKSIAHKMHELDSFVVCGHVSPDGDCIGSQLALYHALKSLGKKVICVLAKDEPIEQGLLFLPGVDMIVSAQDYHESVDAFIACDVPTLNRMGAAQEIHARCEYTFTLDHHQSKQLMSDFNYIDPRQASTTMIIWDLIAELGIQASPDMALCAYTGLMTDTGGFRFQNADALAFAAASKMVHAGANPAQIAREVFQNRTQASLKLEALAIERLYIPQNNSYALSYLRREDFENLHATKNDADPLINTFRALKGISAACILREQEGSVRGSIRAKDDADVAKIATYFNGGGHKAAAGFTVYASLDEAIEQVKSLLDVSFAL